MRIPFLGSLLLVLSFSLPAQLDTLHFIPPVHEAHGAANQGAFYISTPSVSPVSFTLENGGGNLLASGTVDNANPFIYQMNGSNINALLPLDSLNQPVTNAGFIVRSAEPVYANLRYEAVNNNQSFSITSKGQKAFGTSFRIGHALADNASASKTLVAVMATEDNTQITIDLTGSGIVFMGTAPPSTATPITITLNRGESYHLALNNATNGANRNNMLGRQITSNRPIVMVSGNYLGCFISGNHDIGLDQPVAENLLGTSYAFLQGLGTTAMEKVIIVANQNGTDVFLNGNVTPLTTLNAGQFIEIPGTSYNADSVMYVQTSQPAYAWQVLFGRNSFANWGLNFVPPVSCLAERFIDNIPAIDSVGTRQFTGNLNVITYSGSTLLVNGAAPAVAPVNIPGSNLVAYRIHGLSGTYSVSSNTIAVVGIYGANGPSSYAGYFSGFDSIPDIFASITDTICPDSLFVNDGFDTYQWLYNGSPIPLATDTFIPLNGVTGPFNVIVTKGSCTDTSGTYTIACVLPIFLETYTLDCWADGTIQVAWSTASEDGIEAFAVDGSLDGNSWFGVDQVAAHGAGAYLLETRPPTRYNMLRLRQVDVNGYSRVLRTSRLDCGGAPDLQMQVLEQPAQGGTHIKVTGPQGEYQLEAWSIDGKRLVSLPVVLSNGQTLDQRIPLSAGTYIVRLIGAGGSVHQKVLVW